MMSRSLASGRRSGDTQSGGTDAARLRGHFSGKTGAATHHLHTLLGLYPDIKILAVTPESNSGFRIGVRPRFTELRRVSAEES